MNNRYSSLKKELQREAQEEDKKAMQDEYVDLARSLGGPYLSSFLKIVP